MRSVATRNSVPRLIPGNALGSILRETARQTRRTTRRNGVDGAQALVQCKVETVGAALGPRLKRIPDGETGERGDWITWLEPVFAKHPKLEKSDELFRLHAAATPRIRYRLKRGVIPDDITF